MSSSQFALFREVPTSSETIQVSLLGDATYPMRFFFWADVIAALRDISIYDQQQCAIATITGSYGLGPSRPFVEITGFQDLLYFDPEEVEESTLHAHVLESVQSLLRQVGPPLEASRDNALGLFLSVPGSKAKLNELAVRLHASVMNVPYQFVLMVDSTDPEEQLALYARRPKQAFVNASMYVITRRETVGEDAAADLSAAASSPTVSRLEEE